MFQTLRDLFVLEYLRKMNIPSILATHLLTKARPSSPVRPGGPCFTSLKNCVEI
jgi:hypothetical protein